MHRGRCGEDSGGDKEVGEDEGMCRRNFGIRVRVPRFKFMLHPYEQFRTISLVYREKKQDLEKKMFERIVSWSHYESYIRYCVMVPCNLICTIWALGGV